MDNLKDRRFPGYHLYAQEWLFFQQSYFGGLNYMINNLYKFENENTKAYNERLKRAKRENHTKRILDIYTSYLFKKPAEREIIKDIQDKVMNFQKNCDGKNTTINDFMRKISIEGDISGRCYIAMDRMEGEINSMRDNLDNKNQPYLYTILPQNILDISFDDYGNVEWALIREFYRDTSDPFNVKDKQSERFRLWTNETIYLYEGNDKTSFPNPFGFVPIIYHDPEKQDEYSGIGLVKSIAYLDRDIFNSQSKLEVILNDQTFSVLTLPYQNDINTGSTIDTDDTTNAPSKELTLGIGRVLEYDGGAGKEPKWIAPDPRQAEVLMKNINESYHRLYSTAGLLGEIATETKVESGIAKAYNFDKLNRMLAIKSDQLEDTENKIYDMFNKITELDTEVKVDFPETFDLITEEELISEVERIEHLQVPEIIKIEAKKRLINKKFSKSDRLEEMLKETEEFIPDVNQPVFSFDKNI